MKNMILVLVSILTLADAKALDVCAEYNSALTIPSLEAWVDNSREVECSMASKLADLFAHLQEKISTEPPAMKRLLGTHAKGVCVRGQWQPDLATDLSAEQKQVITSSPIFSENGNVRMRFANASSRKQHDAKPDVRGLSLQIDVGGKRQDLAMNNVPRFQIPSLADFLLIMNMQKGIHEGQIRVDENGPNKSDLGWYLLSLRPAWEAPAVGLDLLALANMGARAQEDSTVISSYASQSFWTTTAFAFSARAPDQARAAKFAAIPCSAGPKAHSNSVANPQLASQAEGVTVGEAFFRASGQPGDVANYLGEELRSQSASGNLCYDLYVQFLNEVENKPFISSIRKMVEDPTIVWQGPIHRVARMIASENLSEAECDDPNNAISVKINAQGLTGLGQINRAREASESRSRRSR